MKIINIIVNIWLFPIMLYGTLVADSGKSASIKPAHVAQTLIAPKVKVFNKTSRTLEDVVITVKFNGTMTDSVGESVYGFVHLYHLAPGQSDVALLADATTPVVSGNLHLGTELTCKKLNKVTSMAIVQLVIKKMSATELCRLTVNNKRPLQAYVFKIVEQNGSLVIENHSENR